MCKGKRTIRVKCCYKKSRVDEKVTFLGIDKLYGNNDTLVTKLFWLLALLISCSLCTWQVWLCFDKYLDEPTGNIVHVEIFNDYKLPACTTCPASSRLGYDFFSSFDALCRRRDSCKNLHPQEKRKYPFDQLGFNLLDLWKEKDLQNIELHERCFYATDEESCIQNKWKQFEYSDTILGKCQTYHNEKSWYYAGISAWTFWLQWNTTNNDWIYPLEFVNQIAVHTTNIVDKLLVPNELLKKFHGNQIGLLLTEFRNLNSKSQPCTTEENVIACKNNCMNKKFMDLKVNCKWPFLESDLPYCNSLEEIENVERKFSDLRALVENCDCKRPCIDVSYKTSATYYPVGNLHGVNATLFGLLVSSGSIGLFLGIALISILQLIFDLSKIFSTKRKAAVQKISI